MSIFLEVCLVIIIVISLAIWNRLALTNKQITKLIQLLEKNNNLTQNKEV